MARSPRSAIPGRASLTLAAALALAAATACSSGAKSSAHKGVAAIQDVTGDAGALASGQTSTEVAATPTYDAATIPDYSSWTTRQLNAEIHRIKALAPSYSGLTRRQRAEINAAFRAREVRMGHPVARKAPPPGAEPPKYPGDSVKATGGSK